MRTYICDSDRPKAVDWDARCRRVREAVWTLLSMVGIRASTAFVFLIELEEPRTTGDIMGEY